MAPLSSSLALFLCCCIALCVGMNEEQHSGDGEGLMSGSAGSGSASGSGRAMEEEEEEGEEETKETGGSSEVAECVDDMSGERDERVDLTSSTAYTAAMCSLHCMESVTSNPLYQEIELQNATIGGVSVFKSFPPFNSENHRRNCPAFREFAECVRGCLVRVEPTAANSDTKACRNECVSECREEKGSDGYYVNPYCSIDCNGMICKKGCEYYKTMVRSSNTQDSPPRPLLGPELESSSRDAQVLVNISHSLAPTNEQGHPPALTAIVYSVVDRSTNVTRFFYKASPEEPLSLEDFACRSVSLSFVLVNTFGASLESPPLIFTVPGGDISVRPPTDLNEEIDADRRPGFFGHAVLNISWSHPEGYWEGVHYYTVKVQRIAGGQSEVTERTFTSPPINSTTSLRVYDREGERVLLLDYNFKITVCTHLWEDDTKECADKTISLPNVNSFEPLTFTGCEPHWDGSLYSFTLHWTIPQFVAYGAGEVFSGFLVEAEERLTKRFINNINVPSTQNKTSYSYTWRDLSPLDSQKYYEFEVSIQWMSSESYKKPPNPVKKCVVSAVPPRASPVLNVSLSDLTVSEDEIQFVFNWSPPATTNGRLTHYLACLGGRRLSHFEQNPDTPDGNDTVCVEIKSDAASFVWKQRKPRPNCLYFQIRAHTDLAGEGNWSQTVIISDKFLSTEQTCSTTTTPSISREVQGVERDSGGTQESSSVYIPVVISAGAVLVLILLVLLTIVTVKCGRIRRRKRRIRHVLAKQTSDDADLMFTGGTKRTLALQKEMLIITADEWEIPPDQVVVEGNIGEGAFGEVLKGAVKGPLSNPKVPRALKSSICIPVAIKMLKSSAKGNERRDFLQEIEMMKKVSEGQNPHVVSMVGCVTVQEPLSLITEFVPYGNLLQYLRTNQRLYTDRDDGDEESMNNYSELGNVNSTDLISFAYQIASGMEYLSSLGIVHRDLASRNILVGEGKVLKITDLGMSRETDEVYVQKTKGRVPLKWMAVESIVTREFTSASDVWAYGVVLWEIGTLGGFPYPSVQNEDLLPLLKRGYRMEKPDNCSSEVYAIILSCWEEDPAKRPTFPQLRATFDSILLAEKKDTYIDLQIDVSKPYYNPDLSSDTETQDNHLKLSPKPGKPVSATSPFHIRGITPSHSDFTDSPVSQRSPRSLSPAPIPPEKLPAAASLQPTTERKNVYVDDPSGAQTEDPRMTLRGQRSPRNRSPATGQGGGMALRPASLQLVMENRNVYVDTPTGRRSIHVTSPPDWSSSGYLQSVPVGGVNVGGAVGGASERGEGERERLTMPEILISLT